MSTAICITSGKGGTGKTSVSSGVACCLAALGFRVVVLDADVGLRNMDIVLGLTDRAVFDFTDVISGRASLEKALVKHPEITNLYLLAAPPGATREEIDLKDVKALIAEIKKSFDFCIIDCPAGMGFGFQLASAAADKAVLVCTPDHASLRDAQTTRAELRARGISDIRLVLNRVQPKMMRRLEAVNVDDSIDKTGAQLLGIVPEDLRVIACANRGQLVFKHLRTPAAKAYRNIARRILGERIPLLKIR